MPNFRPPTSSFNMSIIETGKDHLQNQVNLPKKEQDKGMNYDSSSNKLLTPVSKTR